MPELNVAAACLAPPILRVNPLGWLYKQLLTRLIIASDFAGATGGFAVNLRVYDIKMIDQLFKKLSTSMLSLGLHALLSPGDNLKL